MSGRIYEFIQLYYDFPEGSYLSHSMAVFPPIQPFNGRRNISLLDSLEDPTPASLLTIPPWTEHYLRSIITALETEEEFVGYYSYDDETQVCEGPMRVTLKSERVIDEQRNISHWELTGKGEDGVGRFNLSIRLNPNGDLGGTKHYPTWRWRWVGAATSLGLFGTWGDHDAPDEDFGDMRPGGFWWIWPKTWSINSISPEM